MIATPKEKRPRFAAELDELCRAKISELVQAYFSFEVDEALQRARYERTAGEAAKAYRKGFDDPRTITTAAGAIRIRRPRAQARVSRPSKVCAPASECRPDAASALDRRTCRP